MFKHRWEKQYTVALSELTEPQLLQQILVTLERMEESLLRIEDKIVVHTEELQEAAEAIAAGIDHNTENLSQITLTPVPVVFTTT